MARWVQAGEWLRAEEWARAGAEVRVAEWVRAGAVGRKRGGHHARSWTRASNADHRLSGNPRALIQWTSNANLRLVVPKGSELD